MPVMLIPAGIYLFIGRLIAGTVVDFTQGVIMENWYYNVLVGYLSNFVNIDNFIPSLLIGESGLLTMVPIYLLGLLLPLVFSFYLVLYLLRDSGLLFCASYSLQNLFKYIGLSGEGIIPLMLGFGCVTAALISVKTLKSKREQLTASILLSLAIPCSAQFAIILAVSSLLPFTYLLFYAVVIAVVFIVSGLALNLFLPGKFESQKPKSVPLILPSIPSVIKAAFKESHYFLVDAAPTFALGSIILTLLSHTGGFLKLHRWCSPITSGLLNLPDRATDLFLLAIIKKDLGAAAFYSSVTQNSFSSVDITVILVVMTLFVPCFASLMVLFKDRGILVAAATWICSFILSFLVGALVSNIL
jgi:ferrous iron transport protein B